MSSDCFKVGKRFGWLLGTGIGGGIGGLLDDAGDHFRWKRLLASELLICHER